jgi:hypothetical protein
VRAPCGNGEARTSFQTLATLCVWILWEQAMTKLLKQLLFYVPKCLGVTTFLVSYVAHASIRVAFFLPLVCQRL